MKDTERYSETDRETDGRNHYSKCCNGVDADEMASDADIIVLFSMLADSEGTARQCCSCIFPLAPA